MMDLQSKFNTQLDINSQYSCQRFTMGTIRRCFGYCPRMLWICTRLHEDWIHPVAHSLNTLFRALNPYLYKHSAKCNQAGILNRGRIVTRCQ